MEPFHPRDMPLWEDDQCNCSSASIKRPLSGKWPLNGGWPLNRGTNNTREQVSGNRVCFMGLIKQGHNETLGEKVFLFTIPLSKCETEIVKIRVAMKYARATN